MKKTLCMIFGFAVWTAGSVLGESPAQLSSNSNVRYEIIPWTGGWHSAKADAEARGGHLATITSKEEWDMVCRMFSQQELAGTWLGATDEVREGIWQWVTGEPFTFARWNANEPNNANANEHYLAIQNKPSLPWNDLSRIHSEATKYLLEREIENSPSSQDVDSVGTAESVLGESSARLPSNSDVRYEIIPWTGGWHTAKADAEARGGHLATITSQKEWHMVCQMFSPQELAGTWLGATDEETEGIWQWVTGEPFTFARWNDREPNNAKGNEHYLAIQNKPSIPWNDLSRIHSEATKYLLEREIENSPLFQEVDSVNDVQPLPIDFDDFSFVTRDGTVYQNVKVLRVEPDGITIRHSTGLEKIHARNLSDEDRARFHLTPGAARTYLEQQRKAKEQAAAAAAQAAEEAALAAKARTYELHCIRSDAHGSLCRDHATRISGGYHGFGPTHIDRHYTYYYIRNRSFMPETDISIYAAPKGHIRLDESSSAIELILMKKPPSKEDKNKP